MNNNKFKLQNPDDMNNKCDPTWRPIVTPPKKKIVKNRVHSLEIPQWDKFLEINNEIPTMDFSPIYDYSISEQNSPQKSPQKNLQLQTQSPIRIGNNNVNENKGIILQICDWWFGNETE